MSKLFYKDRSFMVYLTVDGLMDKVNNYCKRYGYSYSKLAQMAIAEKLEREERKEMMFVTQLNNNAVSGARHWLPTRRAPSQSHQLLQHLLKSLPRATTF